MCYSGQSISFFSCKGKLLIAVSSVSCLLFFVFLLSISSKRNRFIKLVKRCGKSRVAWKTFSPRPKLKRSIGEKLVFKRVVFKILIVWWEVDGSSMACNSIPFVEPYRFRVDCWFFFIFVVISRIYLFLIIDEKISNHFSTEISNETVERKIAVDFFYNFT